MLIKKLKQLKQTQLNNPRSYTYDKQKNCLLLVRIIHKTKFDKRP
jgi:hypothetical protein